MRRQKVIADLRTNFTSSEKVDKILEYLGHAPGNLNEYSLFMRLNGIEYFNFDRREYTTEEIRVMEENFDVIIMGLKKGLDLRKYISPCPIKENAEDAMLARLILLAGDCDGKYHIVITDGDDVWSHQNLDDMETAKTIASRLKPPRGMRVEIRYNEINQFYFVDCATGGCDLLEFEGVQSLNM